MENERFRQFLLKGETSASSNVRKRAILRGQLSLLGVMVGIIYSILDYINHVYVSLPFYAMLILLSGLVFWINRSGHYRQANLIFLLLLLFLIYAFADNDYNLTGVGTYFIIYALIALTLCGYEQIRLGLLLSFFAFTAFFVAYFLDLPRLIPHVPLSEFYVNLSFVVNFVVSFLVGLSLLFFSLNINFKTEQELMINNQLLTKANKELDRFVYSASHDLRAPLSSLLGLIEIGQRSEDKEEIIHCLGLMKTRVRDLDTFIREIIDYSRNTRQEIRLENFNVLELVKEVSDGLKFGSGMENIFIKYTIPPDMVVTTDRSRLKVILNNLIGNALKYRNEHNEEQTVSVEAKKEEQRLIILIEDNGIGIPEEHRTRIFDMFYRASEKSSGSGLGLYIVKETLEKLNGKVQVSSQPGKGSVFQIEIPL